MHFCAICETLIQEGSLWKSSVLLEKWSHFFANPVVQESRVCSLPLYLTILQCTTVLWSIELKAACKRTQHCWPTTPSIVGCYMLRLFAHPVVCCLMLLRVVAQSLKPVKLFSQQLQTFLLFLDRRSVAQQCWIRLHSSSNIVGATHGFLRSFPRCTVGPNNVGSCCIRLHTTSKTDGTTPNIVGATMLGVVASVCMQPKTVSLEAPWPSLISQCESLCKLEKNPRLMKSEAVGKHRV